MSTGWYHDIIRDNYHNPHNKGTLSQPHIIAPLKNPSCGDMVIFTAYVANESLIDIRFEAVGCVISQATASLLSQHVKQQSFEYIAGLSSTDIQTLIGMPLGPTRLRCALLALEALQKGIKEYAQSCSITREAGTFNGQDFSHNSSGN